MAMKIFAAPACLTAVLTIGMLTVCATQSSGDTNYHTVGGLKGWTINVNYAEWASREQFMVGDTLLFVYDANHYNVLEVGQTGYDSCNEKNLLMNVTDGEDGVFRLFEAKSYYFISSSALCLEGDLRLAIHVQGTSVTTPPPRPPPPSPPQTEEYSSANTCTRLNMILTSLLKLIILWGGVFN
ncbi:hypothetical protein RHSIM_Rhsim03G0037700 [Rhododendron simsii]|uniref:Phytocyanin domain-containing protein n=1 Tax=Rhododendron simsii TaxID=118357 RepID=A0A834LV81_RHOSS|nr:hypothetical protein RHSIM_Rhsim03G0037700 [Rhododendron simsii]